MPRRNRTHTVSFRLTEGQLQRLADRAADAGYSSADWCRELVLAALEKDPALTRNERFIFEELARVRYFVGQGLWLLANDRLTPETWHNMRAVVEQKAAEVADNLLGIHRPPADAEEDTEADAEEGD